MEYCCSVWAGAPSAPSCYLELLDKLQKQICRTFGPSLACSLEPLAHCQNVATLGLFYIVSSKVFPPTKCSQKPCCPLPPTELCSNPPPPPPTDTQTQNFQLIYSWFAQMDL